MEYLSKPFNDQIEHIGIEQQREAWLLIDWKSCQSHTDRLQSSIAMKYGNYAKMHELRRILYKSQAWNYVCTRKVTQENQGKKTAGIDSIKSLSPSQRYELSTNINDNIERHWNPVR